METKLPTLIPAMTKTRTWRAVWWLAFMAVLIGGFVLVGTGYKHGLPFIDEPDEMTIWAMGHAYIDTSWSMFQPSQPPAMIRLSELIQRLQIAAGDPFINVGGTIEIVRFLSVICFVVSLALVILLGHRLAGPIAGIIAGVIYATLPLANELSKLSTHNLFMTMFFVASLAAGVEGWSQKSLKWIAFSFVLAIISALFKWQGGAAVGIAGLACLSFIRTDRQKAIQGLIPYIIAIGIFLFWALFIHKILEGEAYLPGVKAQMPTPANVILNLFQPMGRIGSPLLFGVLPVIGLTLTIIVPKFRRLYAEFGLWSWLLVLIAFSTILSFYGAPVFERQYMAAMPLLAVLAGIGAVTLLSGFSIVAQRLKQPLIAVIFNFALVIMIAISVANAFFDSLKFSIEGLRIDRHNLLADWARATAVDGTTYLTDLDLASSVQTLYGYGGRPIETPYNVNTAVLIKPDAITKSDLEAKNIRYVITHPGPVPALQKLGLPITKLIEYDYGHEDYRGSAWSAWYVGKLPEVVTQAPATFSNEIVLRGYELSTWAVCRGHNITSQMLWSAESTPPRYYSTFMHLFNDSVGELSEPLNGDPLAIGERPTISWANPREILIGPRQTWTIRADLPIGNYEVRLGVFEPISSERLKTAEGKDHFVLGKIAVIDCGQAELF